jgi:integrase
MSKRANGEGLLRQRPNGSWECRITYQDPDTGERRRLSFYAPTAKAARAKAKKAQQRIDAGAPVRDTTRTVGNWLVQWRETSLAVSDRKESTRSLYAALSRKHLEPAPFGSITLDRLRPTDIEALILTLKTPFAADCPVEDTNLSTGVEAAAKQRKPLSESTIRQIYTVLRLALDGAVRDGLLARNPAVLVQRPGVQRQEANYLAAEQVSALLRAAEASRYSPALALIASTGIRRGEALALKWSDVDLDAGAMKITATISRIDGRLVISQPKTARSRRVVPLPPAVVAMLKNRRTAQKEDRLRAGNQWRELGLVFSTEFGTAVDPRNLVRVVEAAAKAAGLKGVAVHTLRHSAAVALLESGMHIKGVADLLGHSSVSITGDIYGHSSDAAARAGINGLAESLGL